MKVIIAGSRSFDDYEMLCRICDKEILLNDIIVSGTANGADKLGERYAQEWNMEVKRFPADWNKYGKRAGYTRNEEMAIYADALIAFWDGKSRGTKSMIDLAKRYSLKVRVVNYQENDKTR